MSDRVGCPTVERDFIVSSLYRNRRTELIAEGEEVSDFRLVFHRARRTNRVNRKTRRAKYPQLSDEHDSLPERAEQRNWKKNRSVYMINASLLVSEK